MSRFRVTTFKWNADSEDCSTFYTYSIEAINSEDLEHECLGNYGAILRGKEALIEYVEKCYGVRESELVFVSEKIEYKYFS